MVLGRSVNKCVLCPQRYNCATYVNQMIDSTNNYQINNANKTEDQSIIRSTNKSTKESAVNSQEITALFLSIEDNLNKTNQELNKTNQELSNQNAMLKLEMDQIKEELESMKQQERAYTTSNSDLRVEILNEDQLNDQIGDALDIKQTQDNQINGSQIQEKGLELYNKNNSTIFREKKTIFGTKKWVEEKR